MNSLILNKDNYRDKIDKTSLLKEEKLLLKDLIFCFLNKETPPQISKQAYERFIEKLPEMILDGETIVARHIQTDVHRICINWMNSSSKKLPLIKKRKGSIFQKTKSRRRVQHNLF